MAQKTSSAITRALYGSSTATTNDLAHFDIPYACRIVGIDLTITALAVTTGDSIRIECSTMSAGQLTTNDAQGVIARAGQNTVGSAAFTNKFIGPTAIALPAGTRVYLHCVQTGTNATLTSCVLHIVPL